MNKKYLIIGALVVGTLFAVLKISIGAKGKESDVQKPSASSQETMAKELYQQALDFQRNRDNLQAKETYQKILTQYPSYENVESIQKEMEKLNMELIFSNTPTPHTVTHEVAAGDTLGKLAKKYGTTQELIKISNNLKSDTIRLGQKLRVWTGQFNIFVDKSQNILILKVVDEVVKVYTVSTGENNSTPVGEFTITTKLVDPVWFNKGVVVPPESPANVLGTRWLGFDIPGYGIHGTVEPDLIGQSVTAGCVRMRNEEVEELYSIIPMGTKVVIVD
ncbi:MAG TPA: hypothetical protein DD723_02520 [Candidatus Omnitrophica bacterium]|nr:MAG: hypothetical protein A2Z81_01760 [Omnitrophica WOR_2 bacterium GWA2_45_18]OGX19480.1 MAG: hypothetical protein A2Y04_06340 [Omnitrophica WOR_2 bacterium GWC2_45_7]HBR14402.1 hypothetical protein [Candidatus Omnitrophota bacterium]